MCASWTCSFAKSSQPREWATASVVAAKTLVIHATGATQVVSAIKVLSERVLNGFKASAHMASIRISSYRFMDAASFPLSLGTSN